MTMGCFTYVPRTIMSIIFLHLIHTTSRDYTPSSIITWTSRNRNRNRNGNGLSSTSTKSSNKIFRSVSNLLRTIGNINKLEVNHNSLNLRNRSTPNQSSLTPSKMNSFETANTSMYSEQNYYYYYQSHCDQIVSENLPQRSTLLACDAMSYSYLFVLVYLKILISLRNIRMRLFDMVRFFRRIGLGCSKQPLGKIMNNVNSAQLMTRYYGDFSTGYDRSLRPPPFTLLEDRTTLNDTGCESIGKSIGKSINEPITIEDELTVTPRCL